MNLFDGKSKQERNKIIAALVLGVLALVSLFFAFGPSLTGGGSTTATVNVPPAPSPSASAKTAADNFALPTQEQQTFDYQTTPLFTPLAACPHRTPAAIFLRFTNRRNRVPNAHRRHL